MEPKLNDQRRKQLFVAKMAAVAARDWSLPPVQGTVREPEGHVKKSPLDIVKVANVNIITHTYHDVMVIYSFLLFWSPMMPPGDQN